MLAFVRQKSGLVVLLLLFLQLGLVVHRIEHFIEPGHMECGDDCTAFMPATDPPALPVVIPVPDQVAFAVRLWPANDAVVVPTKGRLGFQAHAPPV